MNSTLKTIIYVVFGFMVVSVVARLFFGLLPIILLIGIILYVYFNIKGYFIQRKRKASGSNHKGTYRSSDETQYSSSMSSDEEMISEIIDVDYKEVK